jgi:hypothetical protein
MAVQGKFFDDITDQRRFQANMEALNKAVNPDKPKKPRADVSELEQLTKQLREANKDLQSFQNYSSKEFKLRLDLESARDFKNQLDEILKLRRELGEVVGAPFPGTRDGAEEELRRLNALKTARESLKKQDFDFGAAFREQFAAESERRREILESFEQVRNELLRATGQDVAATGAELGARFAEAMANAIRDGRGEIIDAINRITEIGRTRAEAGESRQRSAVPGRCDRGCRRIRSALDRDREGRRIGAGGSIGTAPERPGCDRQQHRLLCRDADRRFDLRGRRLEKLRHRSRFGHRARIAIEPGRKPDWWSGQQHRAISEQIHYRLFQRPVRVSGGRRAGDGGAALRRRRARAGDVYPQFVGPRYEQPADGADGESTGGGRHQYFQFPDQRSGWPDLARNPGADRQPDGRGAGPGFAQE